MKKENLYFCLILGCGLNTLGQDIHFSQFNEHSSLINPALMGVTAPIKAVIGYKDQWRSVSVPYRTFGAAFDARIKPVNSQQKDNKNIGRLATGISIYNDNAGDGNMNRTLGNISLATYVKLSPNNILSMGLQASIIQLRLNNSKLIFPNQYNGSEYNSSMASGENFSSQNYIYADFAGGLLWNYVKIDNKISGNKNIVIIAGASVYHINKPRQAYLMASNTASYFKYVFHGDFLFRVSSSNMAIAPAYLFQFQGTSKELLMGMILKHYLENNARYTGISKLSCFGYGIYYRNKDATVARVFYEHHERYAIGLSYDVNLSQLAAASKTRGGLEIMLKYTPANNLFQIKKDK